MWRPFIRIGPIRVSTYAATLYIGFVAGVICGSLVTRVDYTRFAASALILLIPALVGGRLWYLLGHRQLRLDNTSGAGLYGGLVLSFALSWPVLELTDIDFWRFWDGAAVVLLVGMAITRFGCLMTGCCAGRETSSAFGIWLPDASGEPKRRYPTQLFESALSAMILGAGVLLYQPSDPPGVLFLGAAAAYGLGRCVLEPLRADFKGQALWTRINLTFSVIMAAGALFLLIMWSRP